MLIYQLMKLYGHTIFLNTSEMSAEQFPPIIRSMNQCKTPVIKFINWVSIHPALYESIV